MFKDFLHFTGQLIYFIIISVPLAIVLYTTAMLLSEVKNKLKNVRQ